MGTVVVFIKNLYALKRDKSFIRMGIPQLIVYAAVIIQEDMILFTDHNIGVIVYNQKKIVPVILGNVLLLNFYHKVCKLM